MWSILERFCADEDNRGVLQGALEALQWWARTNPTRAASLALQVFDRMPAEGPGVDQVRDQCCNIFSGLGLWCQEPATLAVIERMLNAPGEYHRDLWRVIFALNELLDKKDEAVRTRAFALLERVLAVHLAAARTIEPDLSGRGFDSLAKHEQERYAGFLKNIDRIAFLLRRNSGATGRIENAAATPPDVEFYGLAKPLLDKLAVVGHPHAAHSVIETLVHFAPVDPPGALMLIAEVMRAAAAQNYHYEHLGKELIVRFVERYLAEYRPMLRERLDCHAALMEILDVFVRVGWPDAYQLTYRLGEIYR